ncbi:DUF1416 domain-containing protein [Actinorugispora endophytica]|uniref:Uncharacterized protein DUF1416 n=1 Tax=Actinorugispora endophytica TaxID=1605990 RepID=A0A4R6V6S2_9ACTN|nr:DUF1416 domain-containing protein [Actinorugispora endophytica]TDQ54902.1 uncharacterized protein DUF1416 [Actinorugispora endophytica]
MSTCGAPVGGVALADADAGNQAVIQGTVTRDGQPLASAYARLLSASDDFVGEVVTGPEGTFRFFAADGDWKVRVLASKGFTGEFAVTAEVGKVIDIQVQA